MRCSPSNGIAEVSVAVAMRVLLGEPACCISRYTHLHPLRRPARRRRGGPSNRTTITAHHRLDTPRGHTQGGGTPLGPLHSLGSIPAGGKVVCQGPYRSGRPRSSASPCPREWG